jgi:hypothetical protein
MLGGGFGLFSPKWQLWYYFESQSFSPKKDVRDDGDRLIIKIGLPGWKYLERVPNSTYMSHLTLGSKSKNPLAYSYFTDSLVVAGEIHYIWGGLSRE